MQIAYEPRRSFSAQVGEAFGAIGSTFTSSIVALIYFTAAAFPWVLLGVLLFFAIRWLRRRLRRQRWHALRHERS